MPGEIDLTILLKSLKPQLREEEYIFYSAEGEYGDFAELQPICFFREDEGITLVIPRETALQHGLHFNTVFRAITLTVHSSLNAVGLTAAVATRLASNGISANVIAAYYHDHIFVPAEHAEQAIQSLRELSGNQPA